MQYFAKKATGTNADIERHRIKEMEIRAKIEELESVCDKTDYDEMLLNTYRCILNKLLESKARIVSNIGKKVVDICSSSK